MFKPNALCANVFGEDMKLLMRVIQGTLVHWREERKGEEGIYVGIEGWVKKMKGGKNGEKKGLSVFMALFLSLFRKKKGGKTNVCRRCGKAYRSHFPHYSKVSADGTRHRQNGL